MDQSEEDEAFNHVHLPSRCRLEHILEMPSHGDLTAPPTPLPHLKEKSPRELNKKYIYISYKKNALHIYGISHLE